MTKSGQATAAFDTTVTSIGNKTGIVVPDEVIVELGAGKRPSVMVNVNAYEYQTTVGVMGGQSMISISSGVRNATDLKGGDPIHVMLTVADGTREVNVPVDFGRALDTEPQAKVFFANLSNSLQRYHVDNINAAKSDETRQRRIHRAVALFLEGKQR